MKRTCVVCKGGLPWWGNQQANLDSSGVCEWCRYGEPQKGDIYVDTKSTTRVRIYSRANGKVLYFDSIGGKEFLKRLPRRRFLNRYRFLTPTIMEYK